jgi:cytochrome c oxidase cbb3-type subunit 3
MAEQRKRDAPMLAALAQTPIERLPENSPLMRAAVAGGRAAFKVNCVQCHGAGAAGSKGYPNLNDDDWLWGGDLKAIENTITHGARQPDDPLTHVSQMPAFGHDGILTAAQIDQVASHVLSLSGKARDNAAGAQLFGGSRADIVAQVTNPHHGAMPAWGARLDPVTIKMLAAYVHSLGGGEDFVEAAPAAKTDEKP